jgi:hypothetical protein
VNTARVVVPPPELVKALAEGTLVLVLFTDASRVALRDLRADAVILILSDRAQLVRKSSRA